MELETLYDGLDDRVVEKLNPEGSGFVALPENWYRTFRDKVSAREWRESPSSITSFIGCPMKWLLERYIMESSEEIGQAALLGSIVHRILEVFYCEPQGKRGKRRLKKITDALWEELEQGTRTGVASKSLLTEWSAFVIQEQDKGNDPDDIAEQMKRGVNLRLKHLNAIDPDPNEIEIISTEMWCRTNKNGIRINGRIDRISRDPDTELEIVQDWKTGKTPFGDPDVHILEDAFIPSGLYALMRSTISDNPSDAGIVDMVELLYLKEPAVYQIEIGAEEIELADNLLDGVTREMQYVFETGDIKLCPAEESDTEQPCRFCPVSGLCPAFSESKDPYGDMKKQFPELWNNDNDK